VRLILLFKFEVRTGVFVLRFVSLQGFSSFIVSFLFFSGVKNAVKCIVSMCNSRYVIVCCLVV